MNIKLPTNYNDLKQYQRKQVREEYTKKQDNKCVFCKGELSTTPPKIIETTPINKLLFPKGFFDYPVHLHHDHESGLTVGVVHNKCNAILWQYYGE